MKLGFVNALGLIAGILGVITGIGVLLIDGPLWASVGNLTVGAINLVLATTNELKNYRGNK